MIFETLDRDGLLEAEMVCSIHHPETALADDRIDSVFVVQHVADPAKRVLAGHRAGLYLICLRPRGNEIENHIQLIRMKLVDLPLHAAARVLSLGNDAALTRRLRAVGVFENESIVVLRHAPFGGPLHVRTSSGGEFALARLLASGIEVTREEASEAAE